MTYKEALACDFYRVCGGGVKPNLLNKIRIQYFQPNTNCMYLARNEWYLYSKGKIGKILSKLIYLRIYHRYGCCIYPRAKVGKGFLIVHPVGVVIGECTIGENFTILQNCTVGVKSNQDNVRNTHPRIGDNVMLCCNSAILGNTKVCDDVTIGANSLVISDIHSSGTYVGNPVRKI